MILTDAQIESLLAQRSISDEWPWSTNDERVIDKHVKDVVAEIRRRLRVLDRTDYCHYGSGYASFIDCWLYRPDDAFRAQPGNSFHGLVVLFSRLSPYYVLGEGIKTWSECSGGSYMPEFEFVDRIGNRAVAELVPEVAAVLAERGWKRLSKSEVESPLPRGVRVPTVLADRILREFDALFYWED